MILYTYITFYPYPFDSTLILASLCKPKITFQ